MNVISEKAKYGHCLEKYAGYSDTEIFVWGEELINRKLIVYPNKVKQIPGYEAVQETMENCNIALPNRTKPFRCIQAMCDTERGDVYIAESNFNSTWKDLKRSIKLGIYLAKQNGHPCSIEKSEDVVVLDYLVRKGSDPVIKNNGIEYRQREISEEEKRQNGRKQSLIDNPQMFYYYSEEEPYFHDKECEDVKKIPAKLFQASETMPEDMEVCTKCQRLIYLRKATYPNTKQIGVCNRILRNHKISSEVLRHCTMDLGMKMHATTLGEMQIQYGADTWILKGLDGGKVTLWHNNYVITSETERYITEGFHKQNMQGANVFMKLKYIENYSWEGHLQTEKEKQRIAEQKLIRKEQERLRAEEKKISAMREQSKKKRTWYHVLLDWISSRIPSKLHTFLFEGFK